MTGAFARRLLFHAERFWSLIAMLDFVDVDVDDARIKVVSRGTEASPGFEVGSFPTISSWVLIPSSGKTRLVIIFFSTGASLDFDEGKLEMTRW